MTTNNGREALEAPERVYCGPDIDDGWRWPVASKHPDPPQRTVEYVRADLLATAKQTGIDEGLEMAAKMADHKPMRIAGQTEFNLRRTVSAAIRALKSEKANG